MFFNALDNRFALIVPRESLSRSRRDSTAANATLRDVQEHPTTRGVVILDGRNPLSAWDVTPEFAVISSIELHLLRSYLKSRKLPSFIYEVVGPGQLKTGSAMRDLAEIALALRSKDSGIHPLIVDA